MLELDGVTVSFGGLTAVDGVNLQLPAGARHALIGPNGAGKSTLLHAIAGTVAPSAGRIVVAGRDLTAMPAHRRARLGVVRTFQHPALLRRHSARDNIAAALYRLVPWPGRAGRRAVAAEADRLLERVGLAGAGPLPAGALAHAQQRQLEFAIALALRPRLLLLDEPAAGLAAAERDRLAALVRGLAAGVAVLLVDHDLDLVFDLATGITVLHEGRVVASGPPEQIRGDARAGDVYLGAYGGVR